MGTYDRVGVYVHGVFWREFSMAKNAKSIPIRVWDVRTEKWEVQDLTIATGVVYGKKTASITDESVKVVKGQPMRKCEGKESINHHMKVSRPRAGRIK